MYQKRNSLIDGTELERLAASRRRDLLEHTAEDRPPRPERRVYVNRTLRMETIRHIGFDLDWTLADYDQAELSRLVFELARERLVEQYGYPPEVLGTQFRASFSRRGLMLDTKTGMVLKMNRHRYVGRACHGREFLNSEQRGELYRREPIQPASDRFYFVDTLFELPEVNLFSELVELKKGNGGALPDHRTLFQNVRAATDSVHADGTLKSRILKDLPRYLPRDPELLLSLTRLALNDRRLLLITNSEWYYTNAICRYLFEEGDDGVSDWQDLFDLVIVEARKPGFFRKQIPFGPPEGDGDSVAVPQWGGCYRGGCRGGLMELLDCPGEQVLYVGDHIYGDILSSKRVSTWRTALVVRELEDELVAHRELSLPMRHLDVLREELAESGRRMDDVADLLALYRQLAPAEAAQNGTLEQMREYWSHLKQEHRAMRHHKNRIHERISRAINPYWGSVFKMGSNKSLFGSQVDDFACIYTSRVSNLAAYGSHHYFRVMRDIMMHEAEV